MKKIVDLTKQADQAVKKMRWYDVGLVKLSVAAFVLMVAKLFSPILGLKWWVYLIIAVIAAIKPTYTAYLQK
ncbi:MAG: hypothetical protein CMH62_01845 [Nanoarchaeota archaeon]|nr:hypothetical protein [Nanoarchaeota archaeon]